MKKASIKKEKKNDIYFSDRLRDISLIAHQMKKGTLFIIKDIISCKKKYKASIDDYFKFEMYRLNKHERKTILTKGLNNDYVMKYNDIKYIDIFIKKEKFYQKFSEYIKREWVNIEEKNKFALFCVNHRESIVKPNISQNGENIESITVSDYKLKELYEKLIAKNQTIIEEKIEQAKEMNSLHPKSVNTIRITTLLGSIVSAYLKIGNNNNITDSYCHEGLIAPIDIESGIITSPATNKKNEQFDIHPITEEKIIGFKIPKWKELKKICEELVLEVPQIGYVSWDFAISTNDIILIKGNAYPEYDLYGLPSFCNQNIGLLPAYKQAEERKYEE